jgi:diaminopimelate decarboxylase
MTATDSAARPAGSATAAPAVRADLPPEIWPLTAHTVLGGGISVGGVALTEIAAGYGTPAYVLDETDVRQRCRGYRRAFPDAEIAYAGKAFLCRAMACWMDEEGLSLDVCSAGELAVASSVGFPAERIVLHGNAKTPGDLRAALAYGVGRVVVDSAGEIARIAALVQPLTCPLAQPRQRVLVRVTPDVDAHAHPAVATGVANQKFGFSLSTGAAADAARRILAQPELQLAGLHCHLGSQITRPEPFEVAARRLVGLMAAIHAEHGVALPELNLGGGHGVGYTEDELDFDLTGFADRIRAAVRDACASLRLPVPMLTFEPGRAIVSRAMVTLYRVVSVKHLAGLRTFVAVDGGMSDNPRPALYGARYSVRSASRPAAPAQPATVVGRHCEAGDVLATDVALPAGTRPGDLLAVACTGAYNHSMASNYNLLGRPPVVAVRDGAARLLVRRETPADLRRRDVGL